MAASLLLAAGYADAVVRRDYTAEDLGDTDILVLDQGGQLSAEASNYDHHQRPRDAAPACSVTAILPLLNVQPQTARAIWGWLEFSERLDSQGPFATAQHYGMEPDALFATVSPVETTILRWFEEVEVVPAALLSLMTRMGREKLNYLNEVVNRTVMLKGCVLFSEVSNVEVADVRCIGRDNQPLLGLELFLRDEPTVAAVTITEDDRGDGLSLFRRNDDQRVDFSRLEGREGVVFAHKGGFVAKIEAGVDPLPMIEAALVAIPVAREP